ncbi:unnamed protein product [Blepharisma stoltei]|uniref:Uncharacterized protein n=1 Tax=Blepharisma stoltei TaxID=1481888 RepID=A0AAU9IZK4_9CILI|nr:unnamed protein product [Blepharisma stoltei]
MRNGDFITVSTYIDTLTVIGIKDEYTYKRLEVGIPIWRLSLSTWVSEIGQAVKAEIMTIHKLVLQMYSRWQSAKLVRNNANAWILGDRL